MSNAADRRELAVARARAAALRGGATAGGIGRRGLAGLRALPAQVRAGLAVLMIVALPVATSQARSGSAPPPPPASLTDISRLPADRLFGSGVDGLVPAVPPDAGAAPVGDLRQLSANVDIPETILQAYINAAAQAGEIVPSCVVRWQVLAGLGKVESNHGRYASASTVIDPGGAVTPPIIGPELSGTNGFASIPDSDAGTWDGDRVWDRAVGPMQFIPSSWRLFGRDGSRDGAADPHNAYDAALGAAVHLCSGAAGDFSDRDLLAQAVFSYNHSDAYVATVLGWIDAYDTAAGGGLVSPALRTPSSPVVVPPALPSTPIPSAPLIPPLPPLPGSSSSAPVVPSAPLIPPLVAPPPVPSLPPAPPAQTRSAVPSARRAPRPAPAATETPRPTSTPTETTTPAGRAAGPVTAVPTPAPEPSGQTLTPPASQSPLPGTTPRSVPPADAPTVPPTRPTPPTRPPAVVTPKPAPSPTGEPATEESITEELTSEAQATASAVESEPTITYTGELVSGTGLTLDGAEFSASEGDAVTVALSSDTGVQSVSYTISGDVTVVSRPDPASVEIARTPDDYSVTAALVLEDGRRTTLTADFTVTK